MKGRGFGFLFLGIGLLVAGITWSIAIVGLVERSDWVQTEGVIVEVFETRDRESGDRMYNPTVAYQAGSETLSCDSDARSSSRPDIGETMTVSYDPENPSACRAGGRWVKWVLFGMGGMFGLLFGGLGISILRGKMTMRRSRSGYGRGVHFTGGGEQGSYRDEHSPQQNQPGPYRYEEQSSDQPKSSDDLRREVDELRAELDKMKGEPPSDGRGGSQWNNPPQPPPRPGNPHDFPDEPRTWN